MTEQDIRYAYRLCPCGSDDIEGIQTWLEDMARKGLLLEPDGTFLGIFTFLRATPREVRYRLSPVKRKKGFFSDSSDGPEAEEQEFSAQCGWEYMVRYGSFYIYRATDRSARPLHTDPAVHAMSLAALKKRRRDTVTFEVTFWVSWFALRGTSVLTLCLSGALLGPLFLASAIGLALWVALKLLLSAIRLSRCEKRLRQGDTLEQRKDWRKHAPAVFCGKLLPWVLGLVLLITWGIGAQRSSERLSLDTLAQPLPFATLKEVFPEGEFSQSEPWDDYGTAVHYSTSLSENYEWNETADITTDEASYYGILRLQCHETAWEFLAKGIVNDYYFREARRYQGKRFQDLEAPATAFEEVRVFSSYGIIHVLIRQDTLVIHATVTISDRSQGQHWQAWLEAMEQNSLAKLSFRLAAPPGLCAK